MNIQNLIKYLMMFVSFYILYNIIDIEQFYHLLKQINLKVLCIIFLLVFIRLWLLAIRWKILIPNKEKYSTLYYIKLILASSSINLFFPSSFGADIIRSMIVQNKATKAINYSFASVYIDRYIGLFSILVIAFIISFFSYDSKYRILVIQMSLFLILFMIFILFTIKWLLKLNIKSKRYLSKSVIDIIKQKFIHIATIFQTYHISILQIVYTFILSILIHFIWFFIVWYIANSYDINISFYIITLVTILVWLATILPISISGFGIRELGFVYLLDQYGLTTTQSMFLGAFQSMIIFVFSLIGLPLLFKYIPNLVKRIKK
jgi:uncharacterized protein (TIRG00374 family)